MKTDGAVKQIRERAKEDKKENTKEKHAERKLSSHSHNSLQHDAVETIPLLDTLVKAIENEQTGRDAKKEKSIAEMAKELLVDEDGEKKDPIAIIAEHIKRMYAQEMHRQVYAQAPLRSYDPSAGYGQGTSVKENSQMYAGQKGDESKAESIAESIEAQNNGAARLANENSDAYKLSAGVKMQAFIMTDPKGRLHSTWNVIRVVNETAEGYITRNDGLHYQGLS